MANRPPADCLRVTVWASWVIAAQDRAGRIERLAHVPEVMRATVRQEVVWHYQRTLRTP